MARIGFIGLGNMGGGMAANLAAAGHRVRAFDLVDAALDRAVAAGCAPARDAADAVADAEIVVTMLPAGEHVRDVHANAVFPTVPRDALLIDCSTIDMVSARAVAMEAERLGLTMVDAPVSGGIAAAQAGTLTFMVGGPEADFERARPVLAAMGKAVIHAGAAGAGQAAKICNNMMLGANMIATCEAFLLAGKLGLDPAVFHGIAAQASGQSWSVTSYCPVPGVGPETPADHGYRGGFAAALMLKDLKLGIAAAQDAGASVPMGAAAGALYQALQNAGDGDLDFSAMIGLLAGKSVRGG